MELESSDAPEGVYTEPEGPETLRIPPRFRIEAATHATAGKFSSGAIRTLLSSIPEDQIPEYLDKHSLRNELSDMAVHQAINLANCAYGTRFSIKNDELLYDLDGLDSCWAINVGWAYNTPWWGLIRAFTGSLIDKRIFRNHLIGEAERLRENIDGGQYEDDTERISQLKKEVWYDPSWNNLMWKMEAGRVDAAILIRYRKKLPPDLYERFRYGLELLEKYVDPLNDQFAPPEYRDTECFYEYEMNPVYWGVNDSCLSEEIDQVLEDYYSNYTIINGHGSLKVTRSGTINHINTTQQADREAIRSCLSTCITHLEAYHASMRRTE